MPGTRKLSRTTSHRNAMLNNLVTSLILNGRVETTLAKAKEVKPLADSLIDLAVKEKDNFEMKEKTISRAKLDKNGKKVKETKTSKNGNKYEVVVREVVKEEVKVDSASKLAARRKMFKTLNKVKKALKAKGMVPLINQNQFYGDNGPVTKYIVHYGNANPKSKNKSFQI